MFDTNQILELLRNPAFGTTVTSGPGQVGGTANIKLPIGGEGAQPFQANPALTPPFQANPTLAPAIPGQGGGGQPQGWMDRFSNYMGTPEGKALGYNIGGMLGAMAGTHPLGQLAQRMSAGGLAGLRQTELEGRQDANLNKVLAAILGNQSADFR